MDDITEQQDVSREISDAISRPYGETFDEVHKYIFYTVNSHYFSCQVPFHDASYLLKQTLSASVSLFLVVMLQ